jgi:hypothetical protein
MKSINIEILGKTIKGWIVGFSLHKEGFCKLRIAYESKEEEDMGGLCPATDHMEVYLQLTEKEFTEIMNDFIKV